MISKEICELVLQKAVSTGADYTGLFAENTLDHSINLVGGSLNQAQLLEKAQNGVPVTTLGGLHAGSNTVSGISPCRAPNSPC